MWHHHGVHSPYPERWHGHRPSQAPGRLHRSGGQRFHYYAELMKGAASMDHALELSSDTSLPLNSPTGFDDFWAAYPRKVGKQAAIRAWPAASRFAQQIADDLRTRQDWSDPTYIPHPSTYLHGRRWEDRPAPPKPAEPKGFAGIRTFLGGESKERQPRPPLRPCWPGLSQEAFGREFATLSAAYPHRELPPETAVVYFQACRHLRPIRRLFSFATSSPRSLRF